MVHKESISCEITNAVRSKISCTTTLQHAKHNGAQQILGYEVYFKHKFTSGEKQGERGGERGGERVRTKSK